MAAHHDHERSPRRVLYGLTTRLRTLGPAGHVASPAGHLRAVARLLRRAEHQGPEIQTWMMRAGARVPTARAERYAKQLCSHAARMTPRADWTPPHGVIEFPDGTGACRMTAEPDHLILTLEATGAANLARLQQIVGGNIERFGHREGLTVEWIRI